MLYCDLAIDNTVIWVGLPCMVGVPLKTDAYLPFTGNLMFFDTAGTEDPTYTELGTRFALLYFPSETAAGNVNVPLQATPSQEVDIVLGNQNCSVSIYER